jgi:hypothetical protein
MKRSKRYQRQLSQANLVSVWRTMTVIGTRIKVATTNFSCGREQLIKRTFGEQHIFVQKDYIICFVLKNTRNRHYRSTMCIHIRASPPARLLLSIALLTSRSENIGRPRSPGLPDRLKRSTVSVMSTRPDLTSGCSTM